MNIVEIGLKNKAAFFFILAILIVLGIMSFRELQEDVFPNATFPRILIQIERGYAPLEEMEVGVVKPLEDNLRTIEGLRIVRSKTSRGFSAIDLFFEWNIDLLQAFQLTQAKISEIRASLPEDTKITVRRMTTSAYAMSGYSLYSNKKSLKELTDIAQFTIKPQLAGIKGVYNVEIVGERVPEYQVQLNPDKLAAYNIDPMQVFNILGKTNIVNFLGKITQEYKIHLGFVDNLLKNIDDIKNVYITEKDGIPIRIADIADVIETTREEYIITTSDWHNAILVNILKHPDANGMEVSNLVDEKLNEIKSSIPPDVTINKWYDLNDFVRRSLWGVGENILLGILVVSLFVFLFLKSLRASFSIIIIMPLSVVLTFLVMRVFHSSLNIMTLGGLVASIGILVDNAVVVVENIIRYRNDGQKGETAILNATSEIIPPMLGATITTMIVFVPFVFLTELTGVFFRPMAFVLGSSICISLALAIFITPSIASILFDKRAGIIKEGIILKSLKILYEKVLGFVFKQSWIVFLITIIIVAASVYIFPLLETGFLPEWDEGTIVLDYVAPPGTSLEETDRMMRKIEDILKTITDVKSYSRRTGVSLAESHPAHEGDFLITLKNERSKSTFDIIHHLETEVKKIFPSLEIDLFQVLPDRLADFTGRQKPLVIKVFGNNYSLLVKTAEDIRDILKNIDGLHGVILGVTESEPEFNIMINNFNASRFSLTAEDVSKYAKLFLWGEVSTRIKEGIRLVGVRLRYPPEYRNNIGKLEDFLIYSPKAGFIPLKTVADIKVQNGLTEIYHENGSIMVPVFATIEGRDLGSVIKDVKSALHKASIPRGTSLGIAGDYESQMKSFGELLLVILSGIFFIFIILLFEFKSLKISFAVIFGTLCSASFIIFGLWFTQTQFNVSSFIGLITTFGIIINNGIILIDFTEKRRKQGENIIKSLIEAGKIRIRPILITNITTLIGFTPLALQLGAGGEILQPFAIAVISGLVGSMIFSLIFIPTFYYSLLKNQELQ